MIHKPNTDHSSACDPALYSAASAAFQAELRRLEDLQLQILKSATDLYASALAVLLAEQAQLQAAIPSSSKLN